MRVVRYASGGGGTAQGAGPHGRYRRRGGALGTATRVGAIPSRGGVSVNSVAGAPGIINLSRGIRPTRQGSRPLYRASGVWSGGPVGGTVEAGDVRASGGYGLGAKGCGRWCLWGFSSGGVVSPCCRVSGRWPRPGVRLGGLTVGRRGLVVGCYGYGIGKDPEAGAPRSTQEELQHFHISPKPVILITHEFS